MAQGKRKTTEEFIGEAMLIHGNKYDYSRVRYTNKKTKVTIGCPEHGDFELRPDNHLHLNQGCKYCYYDRNRNSIESVIKSAMKIHGDKYDYSKSVYVDNRTPMVIICPEHGEFKKSSNSHISAKSGCPTCSNISASECRTKTHDEFLVDAVNTHGDRYEYLTQYVKSTDKITIKCTKCGHTFEQEPRTHVWGRGCPVCKHSTGESEVRQILLENGIDFIPEHKFDDCRNVQPLPFDFYLPELNTCIEYDGRQHFEPVEFFGGEAALKEIKKRDTIKTNYCNDNDVTLLRIRYDEDVSSKLQPILAGE